MVYALLQNRDNSGLLGTPVCYSLKLGGGGASAPLHPLWSPPPLHTDPTECYNRLYSILDILTMLFLGSCNSYTMQRLHQFYQLEPKGVARGREQIKTDAAFACMVQLIYS